jgi:hypothetical protein
MNEVRSFIDWNLLFKPVAVSGTVDLRARPEHLWLKKKMKEIYSQ